MDGGSILQDADVDGVHGDAVGLESVHSERAAESLCGIGIAVEKHVVVAEPSE